MDKEFYKQLLPLVNDKVAMEALKVYSKARIDQLHIALEQATGVEPMKHQQGRIAELRRFATLREEVLKGSE